MKKEKLYFYLREEDRNEEEKKTNKASYRTLINRYVDNMILCNNITSIDEDIYYKLIEDYQTEEDEDGEQYNVDIFQFYIVDCSDYEAEKLKKADVLIAYSDVLDCYIIGVDHYGTSWDYVLTSLELTDDADKIGDDNTL